MSTATKPKLKIDESLFYNPSAILSRNGIFNFVVAGRGTGKTFAFKVRAITQAIKYGKQFIYLRRYRTELVDKDTFFGDVAWKFPEFGFRVNGNRAEMTREPHSDKPQWELIGFFVALSQGQQKKSVPYHDVHTIMFDEFIIEKGAIQYLPNEVRVMQDFYSTVDRNKDQVKVFFMANSISITNPYFIAYNIEPDKEWQTLYNGFVVCHFPNSTEFREAVYQTRFGAFIQGTEYGNYSIGNEFKDNTQDLIAKKSESAVYMFSVETEMGTFSVWKAFAPVGEMESHFFVMQRRPKDETLLTLIPEKVSENKHLLLRNDVFAQVLRTAFRGGRVYFDKAATRNAFVQMFVR